jgi:hypothetical protein
MSRVGVSRSFLHMDYLIKYDAILFDMYDIIQLFDVILLFDMSGILFLFIMKSNKL